LTCGCRAKTRWGYFLVNYSVEGEDKWKTSIRRTGRRDRVEYIRVKHEDRSSGRRARGTYRRLSLTHAPLIFLNGSARRLSFLSPLTKPPPHNYPPHHCNSANDPAVPRIHPAVHCRNYINMDGLPSTAMTADTTTSILRRQGDITGFLELPAGE
jgi:hypothetical protein